MRAIDLNPIIAREIRTRWRGRNSFLLVCGYTALTALVIGYVYFYATNSAGRIDTIARMAQEGRTLFLITTVLQSFAWMLLAPTLTATSIAVERERGLLEGVQLSHLTPRQIVWGKLLSNLTFALLIIVVSLPVSAICFFVGGVSPSDFIIALLLHLSCAILGACIGLFCSAWSRRGNVALRLTYVMVAAWNISFYVPDMFSFLSPISSRTSSDLLLDLASDIGTGISLFFSLVHPVYMTVATFDDGTLGWAAIDPAAYGIPLPLWLLAVIAQLALSGLLLWLATRALRRPFAEQYWIERNQSVRKRGKGNKPEAERTPRLWWEIPLVAHWPFANPVLQREARGKFRMRQAPLWALVFEGLLGLVVLYWYLRTLWAALFVPAERETIWWVLAFVALFVIMLASAVMGASAFTREREISTWEALNMSLLTPAEIIRGKLVAPLLACGVYSLPLWPLLLPCIRNLEYSPNTSTHGVALTQAMMTVAIIATTAWCYTLFGMFCSWRARSTTTAVGATIGGLFVALTFAPILFNLMFDIDGAELFYHPIVAMSKIAAPDGSVVVTGLYFCLGLFVIGYGCLQMLCNWLRANIREPDPIARAQVAKPV